MSFRVELQIGSLVFGMGWLVSSFGDKSELEVSGTLLVEGIATKTVSRSRTEGGSDLAIDGSAA